MALKRHKVTVYTMSLCPVCKMVKDFLQLNEIPYEEIKIDLNPFAFVKIIANTGMLTVPANEY